MTLTIRQLELYVLTFNDTVLFLKQTFISIVSSRGYINQSIFNNQKISGPIAEIYEVIKIAMTWKKKEGIDR